MQCPSCGEGTAEHRKYCSRCGRSLERPEAKVPCPACGRPNFFNASACAACGEVFEASVKGRGAEDRAAEPPRCYHCDAVLEPGLGHCRGCGAEVPRPAARVLIDGERPYLEYRPAAGGVMAFSREDAYFRVRLTALVTAVAIVLFSLLYGPEPAAYLVVIYALVIAPWYYLSWRKARRRAEGERVADDLLVMQP